MGLFGIMFNLIDILIDGLGTNFTAILNTKTTDTCYAFNDGLPCHDTFSISFRAVVLAIQPLSPTGILSGHPRYRNGGDHHVDPRYDVADQIENPHTVELTAFFARLLEAKPMPPVKGECCWSPLMPFMSSTFFMFWVQSSSLSLPSLSLWEIGEPAIVIVSMEKNNANARNFP